MITCASLLLGLGTTSAFADFTTIKAPSSNEAGFNAILSSVYGGSFVKTDYDYSNGTIKAVRVDDADDKLFPSGSYIATAKAVFAAYSQSFGYLAGASGGSYVNLFDVTGSKFNVTGSANLEIDEAVRFARNGSMGVLASSDPSDNLKNADHLVTYRIEGLGGNENVYLLGFEDKSGGDFDYNDLVVELRSVSTPITAIPSPAAFGAGLMLLGGLVARRRRN